jgi:hypothetical protein
MSTLSTHMWSNSVAKQSHPLRGTCLDHIWSKSAAWQSPATRGTYLDHIWSKFAVRHSPPTRGTFRTTFGQSPLHDKVFQQGAQFGPHLVEVNCMTKSSNVGHNLDHIWSKSTVRQSPPMRGINFLPHLANVRCVTSSFDDQSWASFSCHIWLKSAV